MVVVLLNQLAVMSKKVVAGILRTNIKGRTCHDLPRLRACLCGWSFRSTGLSVLRLAIPDQIQQSSILAYQTTLARFGNFNICLSLLWYNSSMARMWFKVDPGTTLINRHWPEQISYQRNH